MADFQPFAEGRDQHAASIVEREVISKGRKALLIYGAGHLYRNWNRNITTLLESNTQSKLFVIVPIGGPEPEYARFDSLAAVPGPKFVRVRGTAIGTMNAADVLERGTQRLRIVDGKRLSAPVFESPVRLDELVDAGLYFGRKEPTLAAPDESLYANTDYGRELQRRQMIVSGAHSPGKNEAR